MAVYGELGRFPLYISRHVRVIKYWIKLMKSDNVLIKELYLDIMVDVNRGLKNWASQVKMLLDMYGFSHIWLTQHVTNLENFHIIFKQRVIDEFIQNWHVHIDNSKSLILYKNLKEHFLPELYINVLPLKLRTVITKMRISAHQLRIETGRYARNHTERHNRLCTLCNTIDIEDGYHFFFICPIYSHLRKHYLLPYFYKKT